VHALRDDGPAGYPDALTDCNGCRPAGETGVIGVVVGRDEKAVTGYNGVEADGQSASCVNLAVATDVDVASNSEARGSKKFRSSEEVGMLADSSPELAQKGDM
jgi:hypothetical protein